MTEHIPIMVIAILVTVTIMLLAATPLANFIHMAFAALIERLNLLSRRAR